MHSINDVYLLPLLLGAVRGSAWVLLDEFDALTFMTPIAMLQIDVRRSLQMPHNPDKIAMLPVAILSDFNGFRTVHTTSMGYRAFAHLPFERNY